LARAFGWSLEYVDDLYFDTATELADDLSEEEREEYKLWLEIIKSPHTKQADQRRLWRLLDGKSGKPRRYKPLSEAELIEKAKAAAKGRDGV
jgi:hypothetical protein